MVHEDFDPSPLVDIEAPVSAWGPDEDFTEAWIDESPGPPFAIVVLDRATEAPLEGADLFVTSRPASAAHAFLGQTDGEGLWIVAQSQVEGLAVVARRDGYAPRVADPDEAREGRLVIALEREGVLRGQVHWHGSGEPVESAVVLAWPTTYEAYVQSYCGESGHHPLMGVGLSEEDGSFMVEGLDPARLYTVSATRLGAAATRREPFVSVAAGAEELRVEMDRLFAVGVRLVDANDEPIPLDRKIVGDGPRWTTAQSHANYVSPDRVELCLAGLSVEQLAASTGSNGGVLIATGDHRSERLGPISYVHEPPGFGKAHEELWAEPIDDGVKVYTIRVEQEASGFGSLLFRLHTSGGFDRVPMERDGPHATIHALGKSESFDVPIDGEALNRGELRIEAAPVGRYAFSVSSEGGWFQIEIDREMVPVDPGGESVVDLAFPPLGAVEVSVVDRKGLPIEGGVLLELYKQRADGFSQFEGVGFRGPPFILNGLWPGTYVVKLGGAYGRAPPDAAPGGGEFDRMTVQVHAGETAHGMLSRSW